LIAVNRWRITFQNSGTFSFHIIELPPVQGPAEYAHDEQHQHGRQGNEQVEDVHVSAASGHRAKRMELRITPSELLAMPKPAAQGGNQPARASGMHTALYTAAQTRF
jgi:hypothetical protein